MYRLLWVSALALHAVPPGTARQARLMLESLVRFYGSELQVRALCGGLGSCSGGMPQAAAPAPGVSDAGDYWRFAQQGIDYIYTKPAALPAADQGFDEQRIFFTLYLSLLEQFRPDVIMGGGREALIGLLFDEARLRGIPTVFWAAGSSCQGAWLRHAARIVTDWQAAALQLGSLHGIQALAVGPFMEPLPAGPPRPRPRPWHAVTLPAAYLPGALPLVRALAQRAARDLPGLRFVIAEPEEGECQARLHQEPWPDNVQLSTAGTAALLAQSAVVLCPGQDFVWQADLAAQAIRRSIPVICSPSGVLPEACGVQEGAALSLEVPHTACSCSDQPPELLLQAWWEGLQRLLGSSRERYVRACQSAAGQYDLQTRARTLYAVLQPLLARRRGCRAWYLRAGSVIR